MSHNDPGQHRMEREKQSRTSQSETQQQIWGKIEMDIERVGSLRAKFRGWIEKLREMERERNKKDTSNVVEKLTK